MSPGDARKESAVWGASLCSKAKLARDNGMASPDGLTPGCRRPLFLCCVALDYFHTFHPCPKILMRPQFVSVCLSVGNLRATNVADVSDRGTPRSNHASAMI